MDTNSVIRLEYHSYHGLCPDSFEASKARDAGVICYFRENLQPQEQLDFIQVTGVHYDSGTVCYADHYVALTNERLYFICFQADDGKSNLKKGILGTKRVSSIKLYNIDSITYSAKLTNKRKKYANEERTYSVKSKNNNDDSGFCFIVDEDNYSLFDKQVERINDRVRKAHEPSKEEPILDKLERLASLYRERLISQEEFEKAKKLLLG